MEESEDDLEDELYDCDMRARKFDRETKFKKRLSTYPTQEQVDDMIDQNIEIETNKRMRSVNVNPWTLRFKEKIMEQQFSQLREDMFKSNMLCCFIIWLFIVACQCAITSMDAVVVAFLGITSLILTSTTILVMAEEFKFLPEFLKRISSTLVHDRTRRTGFICFVIILMAITSSISLVTMDEEPTTGNSSVGTNTRSVTSLSVTQQSPEVYYVKNITDTKEIIVNLSLTAKVNRNLTINGAASQICSEECIRNWLENIDITNLITDKRNNVTNHTSNVIILNNKLTRYSRSLKLSENFKSSTIERAFRRAIRPKRETSPDNSESDIVTHPEYIVFTWVLCLIALATALKLYYLIKLFLAVAMLIVYFILIQVPYNEFFDKTTEEK